MATEGDTVEITVIAFGPVAERLGGRLHSLEVASGSTISALIEQLDLTEWISFGLSVAINGERCSVDTAIEGPAEIALLPPVSGG